MMRKSVVLACVLSILVSAVVFVGCGGGDSSSQTPEQVAKAFFAAYQELDPVVTWDLLSADSQKAAEEAEWEAFLKQSTTVEFSVGEVTVDGDKATAEVTGTVSGESSTETVPLVKEDGAWKVDMASMSNPSTE